MPKNSDNVVNALAAGQVETSIQAIGPALGSAFVPGIGQFALGEKRTAAICFALLCLWLSFFLPPFRFPRFYLGFILLFLSGIALIVTASCLALRSRAKQRTPGSFWWIVAIFPFACFVACVYFGLALRASGFRVFNVPSSSMEPTVMAGDTILADMRYYRHHQLSRGNLAVLERPNERSVTVIKRVIATEGDTIRSANGEIYLNNNVVNEFYVQHIGNAPDEMMNFGPIAIPAHKLFVMGDNRDVSLDSRMSEFGLVDESAVLGRALYIMKASHDRNGKSLR